MRKTRKVRNVSFVLATVLIVGGSSYYISSYLQDNSATNSGVTSENSGVNLSPATEEEKAESEELKGATPTKPTTQNDNAQPSGDTDSKSSVNVEITTYNSNDNGHLTVNGRVIGVIENNGKCTLTLTKGTTTITDSREAKANANDTACGQSKISLSKLSKGNWMAQLVYSSSSAQGKSDTLVVEVM